MAHISEQSIERVRNAADVVEVISAYVDLKQRGRNFFGLCPFHAEKTPSFSVNPEKQIYKCFGCGAGGGSINFIMELENLDFVDAIKHLANSFNIKLEITGGESKKFKDLKSQLIGIHEIVCNHYHNLLLNSSEGEKALSYLTERGLSEKIIKDFKIGFSKDSFTDALKLLQKESFSSESMKACGLFIDSEKGYYDRFRSRIMFPVKNYSGNTIAFGGRIFNKDDNAKYVNSPETPIYIKSNVLYGIDSNTQDIKKEKQVLLVEGYMDLLQLVQAGIKNCLAISGTAFTNSHAKLLKRFTNNVFITFDGDDAGKKASIKCGYILTANAIEANIITPPNNLDPDDWVRENGKESILSAAEESKDIITAHYMLFSSQNEEGSLSINSFIHECLDELIIIEDPIIRELMIKQISELTTVDQNSILMVLKDKLSKKRTYKKDTDQKEETLEINKKDYSSQLYDDLIRLCCCDDKNIREFIFNNLNQDWLQSKIHKVIYDKIYIHLTSNAEPPINIITEQISDKEIRQKFIDLTFDLEKFTPFFEMAIDCLVRIEQTILNNKLSLMREKLRGQDSDNTEILNQLLSLEKDIASIKNKYDD